MASFEDLGDSVVPGTPKLATPHAVASPPQPTMPDAAFALDSSRPPRPPRPRRDR